MPQTLLHFSENPNIDVFRPHRARGREHEEPYVWAIDAEHAPLYWFPRECPRVTFWADEGTTPEDRERFLGLGSAERVHVTESGWLARMRAAKLYAYHFAPEPFELYPDPGGFWVARSVVVPLRREARRPVGASHRGWHRAAVYPLSLALAACSGGLEPGVQYGPAPQRSSPREQVKECADRTR